MTDTPEDTEISGEKPDRPVYHGPQVDIAHEMRTAYLQTRSVEPERYQSMITLLATFGDQLGKHAEKLAIIELKEKGKKAAGASGS